jgi:predicted AlkP superfamily phosphohydrolase/phosphomutase
MTNLGTKRSSKKVVVIGLDGATFDLIKPWVDEGKLPNINNLLRHGVWGSLRSVIPILSAPAWVSFMTGKNPGKHGIFDFMTYSANSYLSGERPSIVSTHSFKDRTLWEVLSLYGKRVGVVNVPITYPPREVKGFLISGFMTPPSAKVFTDPEELSQEIPGYRIDLDFVANWLFEDKTANQKARKSEIVQQQYDVTEKRASAVLELMNRWQIDFLIVVYKGTDNMQHYFWDEKDTLLEYYQRLDEIIAETWDRAGKETNIFIISDHGFGPQAAKTFCVNTWLEQQGLLRMREGGKNRFFRRLFFIAVKINQIFKFSRILPRKSINHVVKVSESQIDWANTKAYGENKGMRGININLKGREPNGVVGQEEYEKVRTEIINKLKALQDPETGEKIMKEIHRKEELYTGRFMDKISDIVLLGNHKYIISSGISDKLVKPFKSTRTGNHSNGHINGILIANGPDIKEGEQIDGAELIDIAPTILHMMNIPVPEDMDGRVLKDIFREGTEPAQRDIVYQVVDTEKEKIKDRIRKLKGSGKV